MKLSKIKRIIDNALRKHYIDRGLITTADLLRTKIFKDIDRFNNKRHKRK